MPIRTKNQKTAPIRSAIYPAVIAVNVVAILVAAFAIKTLNAIKALKETGKVAIGQLVMNGREHLVGIKPHGRGLVLVILRYADGQADGGAQAERQASAGSSAGSMSESLQ